MYAKTMRQLLEPLGVYALEAGLSGCELEVLGDALDEVLTELERVEMEAAVSTAEDAGLLAYEQLLPFRPASETIQQRRRAIAALLHIDACSFTPKELCLTLSGCGIPAVAEEKAEPFTVQVSFPETAGRPKNMAELHPRIEAILPCHIRTEYCFHLSTWRTLEENLSSWREIQSGTHCWRETECIGVSVGEVGK